MSTEKKRYMRIKFAVNRSVVRTGDDGVTISFGNSRQRVSVYLMWWQVGEMRRAFKDEAAFAATCMRSRADSALVHGGAQ